MSSIEERLAVLEEQNRQRERDINELFQFIRSHMDKEDQDRKELMAEIKDIKDTQTKYKGVIGGVVLTVSAIWSVITYLPSILKNG